MKGKRGFQPGQSGNPNGRSLGSKNKTPTELREWIKQFITGNTEQVQADFMAMKPVDRLYFYEKLLRYILPPLSATTINFKNEQAIIKTLPPIWKDVSTDNSSTEASTDDEA